MEKIDISKFRYFVYTHQSTIGCMESISTIATDFDSGLDMINFDKVKDYYTKGKQIEVPKSCDALHICSDNEYIDFVEFKRFAPIVKYAKVIDDITDEYITNKINSYNLKGKIDDSLMVYNHFFCAEYTPVDRFVNKIEPTFFLCTDLDNETLFKDAKPSHTKWIEDTGMDAFYISMKVLSDKTSYSEMVNENMDGTLSRYLASSASLFKKITLSQLEIRYLR